MHTASQALAIERQASAQPSLAERVSRPKTRAILGLMRLNFLSVCAPGVVPMSSALPSQSEPVLPKRAAHYLWAVLIARIYEVFPLLCPLCGGQMRIIAFITHSADIRHILDHIGADSEPPRISPARGPPLWDDCSDAQMDDGAQTEPADWGLAAQPAPDFEVDQRISW